MEKDEQSAINEGHAAIANWVGIPRTPGIVIKEKDTILAARYPPRGRNITLQAVILGHR